MPSKALNYIHELLPTLYTKYNTSFRVPKCPYVRTSIGMGLTDMQLASIYAHPVPWTWYFGTRQRNTYLHGLLQSTKWCNGNAYIILLSVWTTSLVRLSVQCFYEPDTIQQWTLSTYVRNFYVIRLFGYGFGAYVVLHDNMALVAQDMHAQITHCQLPIGWLNVHCPHTHTHTHAVQGTFSLMGRIPGGVSLGGTC